MLAEYGTISKLFASGELPTVVSDSDYVLETFNAVGFDVLSLSSLCYKTEQTPKEILLVQVDIERFPPPEKLENSMGQSAVLFAPLVSFGADNRSIDYFVSRLKKINFVSACASSRCRVEQFQKQQKPLSISSAQFKMSVELGDNLEIFAPKLLPEIRFGEWISVAQFLEVALIPNEDYSSFKVNGQLSCNGISIAVHQQNYAVSKPLAERAWQTFAEIRSKDGFPLTLEIEHSKIMGIITQNGNDILNDIKPLTDKTFYGCLTEVGFASQIPDTNIDWTINSQLNEGSGGVHIALGTGVDASHIDFISSNARVDN